MSSDELPQATKNWFLKPVLVWALGVTVIVLMFPFRPESWAMTVGDVGAVIAAGGLLWMLKYIVMGVFELARE